MTTTPNSADLTIPQQKQQITVSSGQDHEEHDAIAINTKIPYDNENVLMLERMTIQDQYKKEEPKNTSTAIEENTSSEIKEYIHVGRLYVSQGDQNQALEVVNKGLEQAARDEPLYDTLIKEKNQENRRLEPQIDFLSSLPYEIACRIIDNIPQNTVVQCSYVSSAWRTLALNYPNPWYHIVADSFGMRGRFILPCQLLPRISHHVEIFTIRFTTHERLSVKCLKFLQTHDFSKLHSLQITSSSSNKIPEFYTTLRSSLASISNSLLSLDITTMADDDVPNVTFFLSQCPNLISFRLSTLNSHIFAPFNFKRSTHLMKIELNTFSEKIHGEHLQKLLQSSANLRWISIVNCNQDIYQLVQRSSPNIKVLIVGVDFPSWPDMNSTQYFDDNDEKGLQVLVVGRRIFGGIGMLELLQVYHKTLRVLSLGQNAFMSSDGRMMNDLDWNPLTLLDFTHLTYFTLSQTEIHSCHLETLLKGMSNLETFMVETIPVKLSAAVFKALKNTHTTLKELSILNCQFDPHDLQQLLDVFAVEVNSNPPKYFLTKLVLENVKINDGVLEACAGIQSLTYLTVSHADASEISVKRFVKGVSLFPHLEGLILRSLRLTQDDLQVLSSTISKTLKYVQFYGAHGLTKDQVDNAFSSFNIYTYCQ